MRGCLGAKHSCRGDAKVQNIVAEGMPRCAQHARAWPPRWSCLGGSMAAEVLPRWAPRLRGDAAVRSKAARGRRGAQHGCRGAAAMRSKAAMRGKAARGCRCAQHGCEGPSRWQHGCRGAAAMRTKAARGCRGNAECKAASMPRGCRKFMF